MPPTLFSLVIFEIGSCIFAWVDLDHDPPHYTSCVAEIIGLVEMRSCELFAQAGLKPQSSWFVPPE
jgi:hypothetical protein